MSPSASTISASSGTLTLSAGPRDSMSPSRMTIVPFSTAGPATGTILQLRMA